MNLDRFITAQASSYADALGELRRGRKTGHWMWWIFPQLATLGLSPTAKHYGIAGADEAGAYLAHPVLGPRLSEAMAAVAAAPGTATAIMGGVDALKLRSSATLFAAVATDPAPFRAVLDRFFGGEPDPLTLRLLAR
ncbi:DUF1810 domain-containing protein [Sphingomonas sp.]|uniref:DUF1810 domain-containing protein n=1 Tax=Sphingomonas sp. TaxID=28214 RepID=UPI003CC5116E